MSTDGGFCFDKYCTVKAQYKNKPEFGKDACCSYDLLARAALVRKKEQQVILKGTQLSGT